MVDFEFVNDEVLIADVEALFPRLLKPVAHARRLAAAKARYETLYPWTAKGEAQGLGAKRAAGHDLVPVTGPSFTDYMVHEAGGRRGWGRTAVNDAIRRATMIDVSVLDAIEGDVAFAAFNTNKVLDDLTRIGREYQMAYLRFWADLGPEPTTPGGNNVVPLFRQDAHQWWSDLVVEDSATRFHIAGMVDLRLGDSIAIMATLPEASVDAIVSDPPYGVNYKDGAIANDEDPDKIASVACPPMERVLKQNAFCVLHIVFKALPRSRASDVVWRYHLDAAALPMVDIAIWDKEAPSPGGLLMHSHEQVLICAKGDPRRAQVWTDHWNLTGRGTGVVVDRDADVWKHARVTGDETKGHPTPKPVELHMREMLNFSPEGSVVLDPFMGTGATAAAALRTGRQYIGIELEQRWFDKAVERVKDELAKMEAPEAVRRLAA